MQHTQGTDVAVATASAPPPAPRAADRLDQHPAAVYLMSLAPSSRRTQGQALDGVASMLTDGQVTRWEDLNWATVRYPHVAALRSSMLERDSAPATVNRTLSAVKGVVAEAWRLGLVTAEERERVKDVKSVKARRLPAGRHVEPSEIRALFSTLGTDAAGARDAAMLSLLYGGGLRRAEAVAVQVADYNPDTGTIRIRHGKGDAERVVFATNGGKQALDAWLAVRGDAPGALLQPVHRHGKVRFNPDGMTAQAVMLRLRTLATNAGVAPFTPHDLRRSFVGELLDGGADISAVQRLAGHASVATTTRYDRRPEHAQRRAAELLHVPYTAASS